MFVDWFKNVSAMFVYVYEIYATVVKAKCKDKDAERTSELGEEEHEDNVNMMKTNIEIKVEEEFPAGINVVRQ